MNNNTTTTLPPIQLIKNKLSWEQLPEILIYLISCLGNIVVIITIIKERRLRNSLNYLVLNLSLSNILFVTFSIPFSFVLYVNNNNFIFGAVGCKLIFPLATWAINVSVMSLLTITIDRYVAIVHSMTWRSSQKHTFKIILANHVYGLITVIPYMVTLELTSLGDGFNDCEETWGQGSKDAYTIVLFLLQYAIPLPVMIVLYTRAFIYLKRQNDHTIRLSEEARTARSMSCTPATAEEPFQQTLNNRQSVMSFASTYSYEVKHMLLSLCTGPCQSLSRNHHKQPSTDSEDYFVANKRRRQTIRTFLMFLLIIVIFAISSLPNQITWLIICFFPSVQLPEAAFSTFSILHYANCVVNPFIYGGLNKYFWRGYKRIFFCKKSEEHIHSTPGTSIDRDNNNQDMFKEGIITRNPVIFINAGSLDSILDEVEDEWTQASDSDAATDQSMSKKRVKFKLSVGSLNFRRPSVTSNDSEKRYRKLSTALVKDRQRKLTLPVLAASNIESNVKERIRKTSVPAVISPNMFTFDDSFSVLPPAKKSSSLKDKLNILNKSSPKRKQSVTLFASIEEQNDQFFLQLPEKVYESEVNVSRPNQNELDEPNTNYSRSTGLCGCNEPSELDVSNANNKRLNGYHVYDEASELDETNVYNSRLTGSCECDEFSNCTGETCLLSDSASHCSDCVNKNRLSSLQSSLKAFKTNQDDTSTKSYNANTNLRTSDVDVRLGEHHVKIFIDRYSGCSSSTSDDGSGDGEFRSGDINCPIRINSKYSTNNCSAQNDECTKNVDRNDVFGANIIDDSTVKNDEISNSSVTEEDRRRRESDNSELDRMLEEIERIEESSCLDSNTDDHLKFFELLSQLETHSLIHHKPTADISNNCRAGVSYDKSRSRALSVRTVHTPNVDNDTRNRTFSCDQVGKQRFDNRCELKHFDSLKESYI